jgi:hypothetical protein
VTPAEEIGADQDREVKEIQKGPLVRDKKEDSPGNRDQEENNDELPINSELP